MSKPMYMYKVEVVGSVTLDAVTTLRVDAENEEQAKELACNMVEEAIRYEETDAYFINELQSAAIANLSEYTDILLRDMEALEVTELKGGDEDE